MATATKSLSELRDERDAIVDDLYTIRAWAIVLTKGGRFDEVVQRHLTMRSAVCYMLSYNAGRTGRLAVIVFDPITDLPIVLPKSRKALKGGAK
jgi:hypothetical protein